MTNEIEQEVLNLLSELCGEPIRDPEQPLFESGALDSLGLAEFLEAAEDRWNVEIHPTRYTRSELSTPRKLAAIILSRLQEG